LKEYQSLPQQHFPQKYEQEQRMLNKEGIKKTKGFHIEHGYPE